MHVRIPETMGGLSCVSLMAPLHRQYKTARSRNLAGICLIENKADADSDIGFARLCFCSEVPIRDTHESPTNCLRDADMHPSDCPNVEETRNPMQTFSRKKCSHFSPTNFHLHFHMKSPSVFPVILLIKPKHGMLRATPPLFLSLYNVFLLCVIRLRRQTPG